MSGGFEINAPASGSLCTVEQLDARLRDLHRLTAQTPLFNPVFQLGLELSRALENGEMSLDHIESLVAEMECEGLRARAARLDRILGKIPLADNDAALVAAAGAGDGGEDDFSTFAARWQRPGRARRFHRASDLPAQRRAERGRG